MISYFVDTSKYVCICNVTNEVIAPTKVPRHIFSSSQAQTFIFILRRLTFYSCTSIALLRASYQMATFYVDMLELIHIVNHLDPKASSLLCYQEYEKGIRPLLLICERCKCVYCQGCFQTVVTHVKVFVVVLDYFVSHPLSIKAIIGAIICSETFQPYFYALSFTG